MADSHAHPPAAAVTAVHAPPPHSHGAHDDAEHVAKHVRKYLVIGVILVLATILTVGLSYWDFGSRQWNIVVALIVATGKVTLVGAYFMHLKGERMTIWRFLFFTAFFVTGLFALTYLHFWDPIIGSFRNHH